VSRSMNLTRLGYFVAVAEELDLGRAAIRLGMAQPVLGQQMRRLESELGGRLMLRRGSSIRLTDLGRDVAVEAERLLGAEPSLAVGAVYSAFDEVLPGALHAFREHHPEAVVAVQEIHSGPGVAAVLAGRLDVAFVRTAPDRQDLRSAPVEPRADADALALLHLGGRRFVATDPAIAGRVAPRSAVYRRPWPPLEAPDVRLCWRPDPPDAVKRFVALVTARTGRPDSGHRADPVHA
jgi:hypothetical protein